MRLVVIGAVHVSQALAPMAKLAGFDVIIVDPRTAFATPERFPDVTLLAEWPEAVLGRIGLDRFTGVAALCHDPKIDDPGLDAALRADCFYVGALGSRKTHAARVARLTAAGHSEEAIARIRAPDRPRHRRRQPGRDRRVGARRNRGRAAQEADPGREGGRALVRFGPVPIEEAEGSVAAHGVQAQSADGDVRWPYARATP